MNVKPSTTREGKAGAKAAKDSTKGGQQVTRANTHNRKEVRQQTIHRQGHPK